MDESALRTLIANLEACRSSDHWWFEFCTALVAIGVLFEVIFVIWEYVDESHDFRRGIVHPPEKPNIILFALGLLGAGLVAIGVSGELWFESKIETKETYIRKANDDLFLLLSKEAGDAAASANTAQHEAVAVKTEYDALKMRLDTASSELSNIEYRTLLMGPREKLLVGKRRQKLVDALTPFAGQKIGVRPMALRVTILGGLNPTPSDFEERDGLAKSLIGVLKDARWNAPTISLNRGSTLGGNGVSVHFFPDAPPSTRKAAGVLVEALGKVPLATSGPTSDLTTTEESDKATIILVVHLR